MPLELLRLDRRFFLAPDLGDLVFEIAVVIRLLFFFSSRRRHTRCLSDWSSDVCSSDLGARHGESQGLRHQLEPLARQRRVPALRRRRSRDPGRGHEAAAAAGRDAVEHAAARGQLGFQGLDRGVRNSRFSPPRLSSRGLCFDILQGDRTAYPRRFTTRLDLRMAPDTRRAAAALLCILMLAGVTRPAFAFRFVNWNILNWPGTASTAAVREPAFRTVIADIQPDVLVVQEMQSQAGVDQFLNNVLNVVNPGQWVAVRFHDGPDTDNAFFYKPSVVTIVDSTYIPTDLRDIGLYRFRLKGYTTPAAEISAFSMHLKASNTLADQHQRRIEAVITRNYANGLTPGTNFVYCGDMNVYTNTDSGYVVFLENQADNDGRAHDPLNRQGAWNNNGSFADVHTQSTRVGTLTPGDGGATGGLDDRFDQVLFSPSMDDGQGLDWISPKYVPWGNDSLHFNKNINDLPVNPMIG